MKLTNMSLVAAILIGSSAFAIENTKVSGDAKLYYATDDSTTADLFDKKSAAGQVAIDLSITTDLTKSIKAGVSTTALTTLGLENNLVSNVWEGGTPTAWWVSEAWMSRKLGATDVVVGRQSLDTPFAFTETWSIANNTFDAAVLVNNDIANTTLIGAYIGQTNSGGTGYGSVVNVTASQADSFATDLGAYAAGVVNTSISGVSAQAWYYDLQNDTNAMWFQADTTDLLAKGLSLGAQYGSKTMGSADTSSAIAVKAAYAVSKALNVSAAFSTVDKDGASGNIQNAAGQQTKLYTEAWWMYGNVGVAGNDSIAVAADYAMDGVADLTAQYTTADNASDAKDMTELTLTASRSYGALDTSVVYINSSMGTADSVNSLQVYLTLNY